MAQSRPFFADWKATMKPSPSLFTSKPPWALSCSRMMALCSRRTSMQRWSPRRSVRTVESSMSLNMMVTVPSGAACVPQVRLLGLDDPRDGVDGGVEVGRGDPLEAQLQRETLVEQRLHLHRLRFARRDVQVLDRGGSLVREVLEQHTAPSRNVRSAISGRIADLAGDCESVFEVRSRAPAGRRGAIAACPSRRPFVVPKYVIAVRHRVLKSLVEERTASSRSPSRIATSSSVHQGHASAQSSPSPMRSSRDDPLQPLREPRRDARLPRR